MDIQSDGTKAMRLFAVMLINLVLVSVAQAHFQDKKPAPLVSENYRQQYLRLLEEVVTNASAAGVTRIHVENGYRTIESDGIPQHETGQFPNPGNPNRIREQNYHFRMPASPRKAGRITQLHLSPFGVAVNGVPFDPGAAEFWNNDRNSGWQYEALSGAVSLGVDDNNAHVQPSGAYHYHGMPTGLIERLQEQDAPLLIGYAADGFPIYGPMGYRQARQADSGLVELTSSYQVRRGNRVRGPGGRYDGSFVQDYEYVQGAGDLDECNGRTGVTREYPDGTYYYVVTNQFPFIPRCFMGTPDSSFSHGPGGQGGRVGQGGQGSQGGNLRPRQDRGQRGPGDGQESPMQGGAGQRPMGGPPQEAIQACSGRQAGDSVSFRTPHGHTVEGTCRNMRGQLVAVPAGGPPGR